MATKPPTSRDSHGLFSTASSWKIQKVFFFEIGTGIRFVGCIYNLHNSRESLDSKWKSQISMEFFHGEYDQKKWGFSHCYVWFPKGRYSIKFISFLLESNKQLVPPPKKWNTWATPFIHRSEILREKCLNTPIVGPNRHSFNQPAERPLSLVACSGLHSLLLDAPAAH